MPIEIKIRYTDAEYKQAVKEKITFLPNKNLEIYGPVILWLGFFVLAMELEWVNQLWCQLALAVFGLYAIASLLFGVFAVQIGFLLAKRGKLKETYNFLFDEKGMNRRSESGALELTWLEAESVDIYPSNLFINTGSGAILLPIGRFDVIQFQELKSILEKTVEINYFRKST